MKILNYLIIMKLILNSILTYTFEHMLAQSSKSVIFEENKAYNLSLEWETATRLLFYYQEEGHLKELMGIVGQLFISKKKSSKVESDKLSMKIRLFTRHGRWAEYVFSTLENVNNKWDGDVKQLVNELKTKKELGQVEDVWFQDKEDGRFLDATIYELSETLFKKRK
jgi:hypothetical protein